MHARTLYTNGADKTLLGAFLHGSSAYCVKCTFMTDKHARACNKRRSPTCIYTCKKKKQVVKEGCTLAGQRPDATTDAAVVAARRLLSFVRLRCDLFAYRRINGPFVFYLSLSRAHTYMQMDAPRHSFAALAASATATNNESEHAALCVHCTSCKPALCFL